MAIILGFRTLLALLALCYSLPWVLAQQTAPSNATLPVSSHEYALQTSEVSMLTSYKLQPLTGDASLGAVRLLHGLYRAFGLVNKTIARDYQWTTYPGYLADCR